MTSEISKLKLEVTQNIESQRSDLIELSLEIHNNPELGFEEKKSSALLCDYLNRYGFQVEKNIGKLPTAFRALYGEGKPVIALLAEYDALPEIGHACGHNIIGVAATGAGVAAKCAVDRFGGSVVVLGTPAEELAGGKIILVRENVFNDVHVAMIVHPASKNVAIIESLACVTLEVEFFGKAAHAAAYPETGINALEAVLLSFNAINSLRQHIPEKSRIHGIITSGGKAANVVPDYASAVFLIRSTTKEYLEELRQRVLNCFRAASLATGAELKYKWSEQVYDPIKSNIHLAELFQKNLETLGRKVQSPDSSYRFGSTDMGNVSQVVPAIHPTIEIAAENIHAHTVEFREAAVSKSGQDGLIDAAKAMAMTVVDILGDAETYKAIREEFKK